MERDGEFQEKSLDLQHKRDTLKRKYWPNWRYSWKTHTHVIINEEKQISARIPDISPLRKSQDKHTQEIQKSKTKLATALEYYDKTDKEIEAKFEKAKKDYELSRNRIGKQRDASREIASSIEKHHTECLAQVNKEIERVTELIELEKKIAESMKEIDELYYQIQDVKKKLEKK